MAELLFTLVIFPLAVAGLSLKVLAGRPGITGSCGGLSQISGVESDCGGACRIPGRVCPNRRD
ncbi:MAG: (Na+)-NQR maturation NqrM [Gammaproteobacteria bacterium]|jgi:hypothetical protein|nr:(Na+)-NQR maturation NqrM [Gammaproteobacteria bacterium]